MAPPIEKNGFGADGITVGGGFEKKLGDSWSVLTEYRYLRFAGISHFQARSSIPPPTFFHFNDYQVARFENDMHAVRVGIAYKLPAGD